MRTNENERLSLRVKIGGGDMARCPAVAGKFYPEDPQILKKDILKYTHKGQVKTEVYGMVSPHAGYMYSGDVAGALYSLTKVPDAVVIIGPNHTGLGEPVSLSSSVSWKMPWGEVLVNSPLANLIKEEADFIKECDLAHQFEHSIEVQLPFLYTENKSVSIVPITIMGHEYDTAEELGSAISQAVLKYGKPVLIIASSDMSHYISAVHAKEKDMLAINRILEMDFKGLFEIVRTNNISMCGVMPTIAMMAALKKRGTAKGELIGYKNSGEVTGNFNDVVSYAGILMK